jgi:hypothetical protein
LAQDFCGFCPLAYKLQIRNFAMINSAEEEAFRTISAVPGNFARLAFLESLQAQPGHYSHWGLAQDYGEEEVSRAFRHSHRVVLETVLQTDVSELLGDLQAGADERGQRVADFLQHLFSSPLVRMIGLPRHSLKHFNFVLESLKSLVLARG